MFYVFLLSIILLSLLFFVGLSELVERAVFGEFRAESPELERVLEESRLELIDSDILSVHYSENTPIQYIAKRDDGPFRSIGLRRNTYSVKVNRKDSEINFRVEPDSKLYHDIEKKFEETFRKQHDSEYVSQLENV